jgi:hypothetical protein
MKVVVEKVLEDGAYPAKVESVEIKDTAFGERLMWKFKVEEENTEVVGFTSMSYSTRAKAYQWAEAIIGGIDPKMGWGEDDVVGRPCTVVLTVGEDKDGVEKNKVLKVKPPKKRAEADEAEDFEDIPF